MEVLITECQSRTGIEMYGVLCPRAQAVGSYGHHMYLNPEISWLAMHTHAVHVSLESPSAPCEKRKLWTVATAV